YLTKRLDNLEIVDRKPAELDKVFFGAWIHLEDATGAINLVRIVGADEFDLKKGWISLKSPLAAALLGKREGDDIVVKLPNGKQELSIQTVSYDPPGNT
ncbi:GreA/GreB family elongation factor, partial [Pseudomonadales bacterium]|nr:GreA/GreB family elongation factor [Pseudomonadales bacterium]